MIKQVLVPIADGSEEIEAVTIIDVLRRAGACVTVAGVGTLQITASRGVKIVADKMIAECAGETYDLIALPGGMPGAENLRESRELIRLLEDQRAQDRWYAAICAAPAVVLAPHGWLAGRHATCHPDFSGQLGNAIFSTDRVVVDGRCITSQGPGSALEFALTLVAVLFGEKEAADVASPMVMQPVCRDKS
ncbi:MAG: DJ-1 family glyoxalase III [Pseudomonadota bacterium]